MNNRLTANVGVRYDKNDGKNQAGEIVAKDDAISPRVGVVYDPTAEGKWSVTASYAKYVAAVANSIADSSAAAGNPQTWQYTYRGPNINVGDPANPTATPDALAQVWAWFNSASGCVAQPSQTCQPNLPSATNPTIPGVAQKIGGDLTTPNSVEYAAGITRQFGSKASLRADYAFRDFNDFYVSRTDPSTGQVSNSAGQTFDLTLIENIERLQPVVSGPHGPGNLSVHEPN